MELALCQEGSGLKLFIQGITWINLSPEFKDEVVKIDSFQIVVDNLFPSEGIRSNPDYEYLLLKIPESAVPLSKIKEEMIRLNLIVETEILDDTRLKELFPSRLKEGESLHQIWKNYLQDSIFWSWTGPTNVRLGNESIYVESCETYLSDVDSYCITFQKKEKLQDFLRNANLTIPQKAREELEIAAQEGKPYATEGLREAFEEAGIIDRMWNLQMLMTGNIDSPEHKLSKEFALSLENTSFKLFFQGINWKDFLQVFGEETVDVFDLNMVVPDGFSSNDEYFEVDSDTWLKFRRRKLSFKELVSRVSSIKDLSEPLSSNIGNRNFEMNLSFSGSGCCLTFWQKDKLLHFLEQVGEIIPQPVVTELKNALNEGKSYCTDGLRQDFERASNRYRTERLVELINHHWVPEEEEILKIALAYVTKTMPAQLGNEPSLSESGHTPQSKGNKNWLVYNRLLRDGMNCFDGNGGIYGFNGETVIRKTIEMYDKLRSKEYSITMNRLLNDYIKKFGETVQVPKPR